MPRKFVFQDFKASGLPESVFFRFFELRGPPTVHFHKKQLVGASRNLIFLNFSVSGCPETRFFPFFARRLQAKCCFWQFLMKNHKRRAVFLVFRISFTSDEFIHYSGGSQSFLLPFLHPRNECAGGERVLSYHCTYK